MPRKSLRPQLNQIRAWTRQGRTDAWIAHQLEVSTSQVEEFRRRNGLSAEGEDPGPDLDLRDKIEAEIEAEIEATEEEAEPEESASEESEVAEEKKPRRRRRRRGGRGRGRGRRAGAGMSATLEHGGENGYGLRLDDSIKDDPIYAEHWTERTELRVTIEPNRIVVEPVGEDSGASEKSDEPAD